MADKPTSASGLRRRRAIRLGTILVCLAGVTVLLVKDVNGTRTQLTSGELRAWLPLLLGLVSGLVAGITSRLTKKGLRRRSGPAVLAVGSRIWRQEMADRTISDPRRPAKRSLRR